jgi:hypothetical protein
MIGIDIDKIIKDEIVKLEIERIEKEWEKEKNNFPLEQQDYLLISKLVGFAIKFNMELVKANNNHIEKQLIDLGVLSNDHR